MTDTRTHILDLGEAFIRRKGYNAFSYKDIADPLSIRPAAVHYYFPTKEALGAEVLEREIQVMTAHGKDWKKLPADEQLKRLVEVFRRHQEQGFICLMGSLCPDYGTLPPPMQAQLKVLCLRILGWLGPVLAWGREEGVLRFEGEPADRALLVVSALMSSLLLARVQGGDTFERMSTQLIKDLIA